MSNPNPDSWIQSALTDLSHNLASKNEDYRIDGEFSNFEKVANALDIPVESVILTHIYTKLGGLQGLSENPNNEAKIDTYHDLAGYAVILYAYVMSTHDALFDVKTPSCCTAGT